MGVGKSEGQRAHDFGNHRPAPPPPVLGCPARGWTERHPRRSSEGRRPRPRGGRPGARGATAATQWRPPQAPRAPAAASPPDGGGAGRFQSRPTQWGRGRERGPSSSSGRGGYLTHFSETPLNCPGHPQRQAVPIWESRPSPARPHFHHTHPWTPFSLLPSRSLNVRLPRIVFNYHCACSGVRRKNEYKSSI